VPVPHPFRLVLALASALLALILLLAIVLGSSKSSPTGPGAGTGSRSGGFEGAVFPAGVHAHAFTLSDQLGRSISLSAYRGQVVVLTFLSSDCRTCVLVAQQVRGALDELGAAPDVHAIFVSTDPRADTRARVARFLEETSLSGRVGYLTGSTARLRPVWHAYHVAPAGAGKQASEAAITVLLIDRHGGERVGFGLEQVTPESLAHDIRALERD
jgi:cytochrome oxidase Cu insertion factor (SCO1/SenC/PrrC family)